MSYAIAFHRPISQEMLGSQQNTNPLESRSRGLDQALFNSAELPPQLSFPSRPHSYKRPDDLVKSLWQVTTIQSTYSNIVIEPATRVLTSSIARRRMVPVDSVIRGGSYIGAALSIMSIFATILSGAVIIQAALAILVLIGAVGFYFLWRKNE